MVRWRKDRSKSRSRELRFRFRARGKHAHRVHKPSALQALSPEVRVRRAKCGSWRVSIRKDHGDPKITLGGTHDFKSRLVGARDIRDDGETQPRSRAAKLALNEALAHMDPFIFGYAGAVVINGKHWRVL